MIAFNEDSYGEIVLHPPPVSYLALIMVPFLPSRFLMKYIGKGFSYMMFWVENVLFLVAFIAFEAMMYPVAYIKVWINIVQNSIGVFKLLINCLLMALVGQIILGFLIFRDAYYFIKILCFH